MSHLCDTEQWKALFKHAQSINRGCLSSNQSLFACGITLDYSNQKITDETLQLLFGLATQSNLPVKIKQMTQGGIVNLSENKPALHTALRAPSHHSIYLNGINIIPQITECQTKMYDMVELIRSQQWRGFSNKPITDIVHIGIGGSDLGPKFCLEALTDLVCDTFNYHFISDADPRRFHRVVATLNPETTLFIIASKSFMTKETHYNMQKAFEWIGHHPKKARHFIAITAHPQRAIQDGIEHILPLWDWVGGRFSFCSAVNLITAIAIGSDAFHQILQGAHAMDEHVEHTEMASNLPVHLALLGIWNNNFLNIHNLLILTYLQELDHFVPFVQQLEMESNGKCFDNHHQRINYSTCPIIWGGPGNQAQHSYFQLLLQGTHQITADLITLAKFDHELINQFHRSLSDLITHQNQTTHSISFNHLILNDFTPYILGALTALYEHKVFIQSVIWNINAFDQPGVEYLKQSSKSFPKRPLAESL